MHANASLFTTEAEVTSASVALPPAWPSASTIAADTAPIAVINARNDAGDDARTIARVTAAIKARTNARIIASVN